MSCAAAGRKPFAASFSCLAHFSAKPPVRPSGGSPTVPAYATRNRHGRRPCYRRSKRHRSHATRATNRTVNNPAVAVRQTPYTWRWGQTQWSAPRSPEIEVTTQNPSTLITTTTSAPSQPLTKCKGRRSKQQHGAGKHCTESASERHSTRQTPHHSPT